MPRVGSKHSSVRTPVGDPARDGDLLLVAARQAPHLGLGAGVDLEALDGGTDRALLGVRRGWVPSRGPARRTAARCSRAPSAGAAAPSRRSAGTYTRPARMASAGCPKPDRAAVDLQRHRRSGVGARQGPRTAPPVPGPRGRRRPAPRPRAQLERDVLERRTGAQALHRRARSRDSGDAWRSRRGLGHVRDCVGRHVRVRDRRPSIRPTIRSSAPGAMSTTPTVSPSRSTVARSQSAEISMSRWEMKIDRAPGRALPPHDLEHALGQVGRQRGGHLVQDAGRPARGQGPGEVDDAQRGQGQVASVLRQVEVRDAQLAPSSRGRRRRACRVSRRLSATVEVRDDRRVLVHRDDARPPCLGRRSG